MTNDEELLHRRIRKLERENGLLHQRVDRLERDEGNGRTVFFLTTLK